MFSKIFEAVRRLLYNMGIISGTKTVFANKNIPNYEDFYSFIEKWKMIYKGVPGWLDTKASTIKNPTKRRDRDTMGVAKVLCGELSSLTFSEQVNITVSDKDYHEYVEHILQNNGFWKNFPDLLEVMYAIGGAVLKTYLENGKVKVDYVDGDMFIPTQWDNRTINDGVFISKITKGNKYYSLFEWQYKEVGTVTDENGVSKQVDRIVVDNHLFRSDTKDSIGIEVQLSELYPTMEKVVYVNGVEDSLFAYMRPSGANNIDTDSPLGISVFANALDTLKALDVAFDSFNREFILGKKRIIVPVSAIKAINDPQTGKNVTYFDSDDEVYQAMKDGDNGESQKIIDNTIELRVTDHIAAINALLNILCFQTGLSAGSLSFDSSQGMKTATEVISQNSKTYRTKQSHQNLIKEALEETVKSIITLGIAVGDLTGVKEYDVTIGFDDSIIVDTNAIIDNNIKTVGAGLKSKLKAIMEIQKCDEETALRELEQIAKESSSVDGGNVDMFGNDLTDNTDTETVDTTTNTDAAK